MSTLRLASVLNYNRCLYNHVDELPMTSTANNMNSLTLFSIHCVTSLTEADPVYIFATTETCTNAHDLKECEMGPWLVLVSPCFRENVVATCKIGSFLCSFNNLLQKNVVVFVFGNQMSKWRSFEKVAIFDPLFTFFSHQGKVTKIPSAHISLKYIHVFCSPYWLYLPYQFWKKKTNLSGMVSLWYDSLCWFLFAPFWNNQ